MLRAARGRASASSASTGASSPSSALRCRRRAFFTHTRHLRPCMCIRCGERTMPHGCASTDTTAGQPYHPVLEVLVLSAQTVHWVRHPDQKHSSLAQSRLPKASRRTTWRRLPVPIHAVQADGLCASRKTSTQHADQCTCQAPPGTPPQPACSCPAAPDMRRAQGRTAQSFARCHFPA